MNHGALKNENDLQSHGRTRAGNVHRRHNGSGRVLTAWVPCECDDGDTTMSDNTKHTVSESADKIVLKTQITRGEGTRDQDRIDVKVKGDDPQDTVDKLHETVVAIGSKGTHKALRGTQPE